MKIMKSLFNTLVNLLVVSLLLLACSKENSMKNMSPGKQAVSIYLTDDPAPFDKVLIDIRSVQVLVDTCVNEDGREEHDGDKEDDHDGNNDHGDSTDNDHGDSTNDHSCNIWMTLNIQPGVYDLLNLRNGLDILLASGIIPNGEIKRIKIELGPNNSLVKDSVSYPLHLPQGMDSFIVIKLKGDDWDEFRPGQRRIWLDFDVARSIIRVQDNMFFLLPVIHFFILKTTGSIEGKVEPGDANAVISIYNTNDTAYAIPNREGEFKLRGLKEGSYDVFVNASNGYQDTTIAGVMVRAGRETDLPRIVLHK